MTMLGITLRALEKSSNSDNYTLEFVYSKMIRFEIIYQIEVFGPCQQELILNALDEYYTTFNDSTRVLETLEFVENYFITSR